MYIYIHAWCVLNSSAICIATTGTCAVGDVPQAPSENGGAKGQGSSLVVYLWIWVRVHLVVVAVVYARIKLHKWLTSSSPLDSHLGLV